MKLYACCPICAHKLGKGENGTFIEVLCPRCSTLVRISIKDRQVLVIPLENQKKKPQNTETPTL